MKHIKRLWMYISSCRIWLGSIIFLDLFFIFLAWYAYPKSFWEVIGLIIMVSMAAAMLPLALMLRQEKRMRENFEMFLSEPGDRNEYRLFECLPPAGRPYVKRLGAFLRGQQAQQEQSRTVLADYETYIENWVHEIKKPLSLLTLILDNRSDEMSDLVCSRLCHIRDQIRIDTEQILYFSRLGAEHKDYLFEALDLKVVCRMAIEDNASLLHEAGFSVQWEGDDALVLSDKKGLQFIIGQLISNSVKYAALSKPQLCFSIKSGEEKVALYVLDNGPGIPEADLPFIFDKGFTGERGSMMSRSTGMGLYLARKMADDLSIELRAESTPGCGTAMILYFSVVKL